jgi:hypothetical protein
MTAAGFAPKLAAASPLPLAGRGRGWGEAPGWSIAVSRAVSRLHRTDAALIFTPPLTPPRQGEGNSRSVRGALIGYATGANP